MSEYFRIVRGLELDDSVRILQGSGAPGSSADTIAAPVGSLFLDRLAGRPYFKIASGTGTDKWTSSASGSSLVLIDENTSSPTLPAAEGTNSIAIGPGAQTSATATNSIALGAQALARLPGSIVYSNGRFASSGDVQAGKYLMRSVSVNAAPVELFLDGSNGSARLTLPDDCTWTFSITVTAHRTDDGTGHAGYKFEGVVYRRAGSATIAFQGNPTKTVLAESNPEWDINISTDATNGSLKLLATGQSGKIIRWAALVETLEVTN